MFNMSLLTSDAYAILFGVFLFGKKLNYLYFIAFVVIIGGILMYNIKNDQVTDKFTNLKEDDLETNALNDDLKKTDFETEGILIQ